jgi:hypothetical protein
MLTFLIALAGGYLALISALYAFQRNLLYLPTKSVPSLEESSVADMRAVHLATEDGLRLLAWYGKPMAGRPTLVYFHGNGGHIGYRDDRVRPYLDEGWGVLLVGYRGYGGNAGSPSEEGLYQDGQAAMAFVAADGIRPAETVLYGESLGTAVAVEIARQWAGRGEPVGAVVLEAPPSSITDLAAHHYPYAPVRWLLKDRFESRAKIAAINAPLLVVHGDADRVVPIRYGRRLFEAAAEPKEALWVPRGEHETLHAHGISRPIIDFVNRHVRTGPNRPER